jgi:hypothetical protein
MTTFESETIVNEFPETVPVMSALVWLLASGDAGHDVSVRRTGSAIKEWRPLQVVTLPP